MAPTAHLEPGVVDAHEPRRSTVCSTSVGTRAVSTPLQTTVADGAERSGFESVPRADIMRWKYTKLLMNLGNAVDADVRPGDDADELVRLARAEGGAHARRGRHRLRVPRGGPRTARPTS